MTAVISYRIVPIVSYQSRYRTRCNCRVRKKGHDLLAHDGAPNSERLGGGSLTRPSTLYHRPKMAVECRDKPVSIVNRTALVDQPECTHGIGVDVRRAGLD